MASLQIKLFGSPRLELDNTPLALGRRNGLALLAYLAVTGRPHRREALLTLLFPDHDPATARRYLRRDLSQLNQKLGGGWISADRVEIGLNREASPWVDVAHFRALLAAVQGHRHEDGLLCPDCLAWLVEAAGTYTADFMSGFSLPEAPDFNDWLYFEGEALRQGLAGILKMLSGYHGGRGEYEAAIPYAQRWLALDPLNEPAQRQLMRLFAWSGQPAAALRQYEECVRLLKTELGISPEEETTALFAAIKSRRLELPAAMAGESEIADLVEPALEAAGPEPSLPPPTPSPPVSHNLPTQATPFIGREQELAELQALLADPQTRLISIVGPGGMGKTRLALALAERVVGAPVVGAQRAAPLRMGSSPPRLSFEHGVFFADLAPLDDGEQIVPALAQILDFPLRSGADEKRSPRQQLLDYLRRKQMLLLLDNFEHLLDEAVLVGDILDAAPQVAVLATSRERLRLRQEQLYPIRGLEVPDWVSPADAAQYTAAQLFLQSARRVRPDFQLLAGELDDLTRICRLVDGMPLAIELAAAWIDLLSLEEITAEIAQGLDVLQTGVRDVPERQRSLRAVFDHSWERLSQEEQEAMTRFSLFQGGCTREAAGAVSGASLRTLANLSNKSLIQYRRQAGRYQIHALLQQYAAEKLALNPEAETAAQTAHGRFYCAALVRWKEEIRSEGQRAAMNAIERDYDNIRAAWRWAAAQPDPDTLDGAADGLGEYYAAGHYWREGETLFQWAVEKLQAHYQRNPESATLARLLVKCTTWRICLYFSLYNDPFRLAAEQAAQLERELARLTRPPLAEIDARSEQAFLRLQLGRILKHGTDEQIAAGLAHLETSQQLYQALGDAVGAADALYERSFYEFETVDEALALLTQNLAILRQQGDPRRLVASMLAQAMTVSDEGEALALLEETEKLVGAADVGRRSQSDQSLLANVLLLENSQLVHLGMFARAETRSQEMLALYDQEDPSYLLAYAQATAGFPPLYLGRYQQVQKRAQQTLALARQVENTMAVGFALILLGWAALAEERFEEAQRRLQESLTEAGVQDWPSNLGQVLATLGIALRGMGRRTRAQQHLSQALQVAIEIRSDLAGGFLPLVKALPGIALLLADEGERERAVELYALARTHPMVANGQWFEDVAGRHIAAAASILPPEVAAAAEARGRARDLWATAAELLEELEARGWGGPSPDSQHPG